MKTSQHLEKKPYFASSNEMETYADYLAILTEDRIEVSTILKTLENTPLTPRQLNHLRDVLLEHPDSASDLKSFDLVVEEARKVA